MRILFFDIETEPNSAYVWGTYEQNVIKFIKEGSVLCFAYKWSDSKQTHFIGLNRKNRKQLAKELWKIFDEADIIVAHNGDRFDVKKSNVFFLKHGLTPPSPYKTVDTRKEAKKYFMFNSNKLTDLGRFLGLGEKEQTGGFSLWEGCMSGDKKAWRVMEVYNRQDVILLEKVYKKLLPWMKNHPAVTLYEWACPKCGFYRTQARGFNVSKKSITQRRQCQGCGGWFMGEKIPTKRSKRSKCLSTPIPSKEKQKTP